MSPNEPIFSVSDALSAINQTLEYAYPFITVIGEVANFKTSGDKWIFFDIKDEEASLKCFMAAWNLRTVIQDGMKVQIVAKPRLSKYGFSLNVEVVKPVGDGSIKKSFELLRAKLDTEGLFASERKRSLPILPVHIGVVSSINAAGYADFVKILQQRFGGLEITVFNTAVQGDGASDQIIKALKYFNETEQPPEVIVILRGGGSRDDLITFDDELLVREIASSRTPIITGIGHEIDITLADLAADMRASTPSNAAELIVPDRREITADINARLKQLISQMIGKLNNVDDYVDKTRSDLQKTLESIANNDERHLKYLIQTLHQLNPKTILSRGYSIVRDSDGKILRCKPNSGDEIETEGSFGKFFAIVK